MHAFTLFIKNMLFSSYVILYMLSVFWAPVEVRYSLGLLAILCILVSFRAAKGLFQLMCIIFTSAGLVLMVSSDTAWMEIPLSMNSNALLISLLFLLPFMNNVIKIGGYDRQINKLLQLRFRRMGQLYFRSLVVSYVLNLFLFFAAIPPVYEVVRKNVAHLTETMRNKIFSQAILRAFAIAMIWSPIEIMIAMTSEMTGAAYLSMLPWFIALSLTMIVFEGFRSSRFRRLPMPGAATAAGDTAVAGSTAGTEGSTGTEGAAITSVKYASNPVSSEVKPILLKMVKLVIGLILFIVVSAILHWYTGLSFFIAVTLAVVPFSIGWALMIKRLRLFARYTSLSWYRQLMPMQNFMVLFLSLGFFNEMVKLSFVSELLQGAFPWIAAYPLLLFLIIQTASLWLPLAGFHPLITLSLLGVLVQPFLDDIRPESIAIVILSSILATDASGTYNTPVTMMSGLTGVNPYRITFWNLGFAYLYSSMGIVLAMLMM